MNAEPDFESWFNAPDAFDETHLHPDLQPYVTAVPSGRMLRHPLVYSLPPVSWRQANATYEARRDLLAKFEAAGEWPSAITIHERPYRMEALERYWARFEDVIERNAVLLDVWADTESPWQFGDQPLRLFKAAYGDRPLYLTDDDAGDHPILPETVRVFRGTGIGEKPGIAWTLDRDKALWFATRYRDSARAILIEGRVPRRRVLAYIVGRGEQEIVVDPRYVRSRRTRLVVDNLAETPA